MVEEIKRTGTHWMKAPILAGIAGGILLTLVLHLTTGGWRELVAYNWRFSEMYAASYTLQILLVFIFSGSLSVYFTTTREDTKKRALLAGILSGITAGLVFSCTFLYMDILLNPARYPPVPGILPGLNSFFVALGLGWIVVVCASILTGMVFATTGAVLFHHLWQQLTRNSGSPDNDSRLSMLTPVILLILGTAIVALSLVPPAVVMIGINQGAIAHEPPNPINYGFANRSVLPMPAGEGDDSRNVADWMQQHAGQEVTAGEYLDIINPGYLDSRPQNVKEAYYQMKVRVPDINNPNESMQAQSTVDMQFGDRSVAVAAFGYREMPEGLNNAEYAENYTRQCIMNESMISVSNQLVGREISVGKYLDTVCPEFLAGMTESQKVSLYNQTLDVTTIPDRNETAVFVPPLYVSETHIAYHNQGWGNLAILGISGLVVLAIGYVLVRRYRKCQ